ncbi:type II secretion system protein [Piscinibacter sp.]|uniref:type II secretion system protein n=1 Tax=Piscinibacter sp. TaxID=1903157 RepID=UPI0011DA95D1|nr:MAG: prepilin-type N-terminal cleavage/methylation domain-containing protein [Burkholderiaceae bacterium]
MRPHIVPGSARGFTMIELVIVMAMLGLLLSLALPHYMATLERGREQVLQSNLATMREAIDKYYGDRGRYPDKLEDLVTQRYLRAIPNDPYLEAPTWVVIAPRDADKGGVIDVRSTLTDLDGQPRRAAGAPADNEPVPGVVRESGSSSVVTAGGAPGADAAASAAATGAAP